MKSFYEMLKIVEVGTVATTGVPQTTTPNQQQQQTNTAAQQTNAQQPSTTQTANQQQKPKLTPQQKQAFMNQMAELLKKFGINL
jgi:hypothetical protein